MCFKKKKIEIKPLYDLENEKPAIRASICTGEKVIGFLHNKTHAFREIMLVRDDVDIQFFCRKYGVKEEDITTFY